MLLIWIPRENSHIIFINLLLYLLIKILGRKVLNTLNNKNPVWIIRIMKVWTTFLKAFKHDHLYIYLRNSLAFKSRNARQKIWIRGCSCQEMWVTSLFIFVHSRGGNYMYERKERRNSGARMMNKEEGEVSLFLVSVIPSLSLFFASFLSNPL